MGVLILGLLFFTTGVLSIFYYGAVPSKQTLQQRLPNKVSLAAWLLTAVIALGVWYGLNKFGGRFDQVSAITTLLFFLLTFESLLLLLFRWFRFNLLAVAMALLLAAVPFGRQFNHPSYSLINAIVILSSLGATTLIILVTNLRTRVVMIAAVLLAVNDFFIVRHFTSHLPLSPLTGAPLKLLIFPTLVVNSRVVGSGDVMFLVLTTLVLLRDLGWQPAVINVITQTLALALVLTVTTNRNVFVPFLTVMTPIFLTTYFLSQRKTQHAA